MADFRPVSTMNATPQAASAASKRPKPTLLVAKAKPPSNTTELPVEGPPSEQLGNAITNLSSLRQTLEQQEKMNKELNSKVKKLEKQIEEQKEKIRYLDVSLKIEQGRVRAREESFAAEKTRVRALHGEISELHAQNEALVKDKAELAKEAERQDIRLRTVILAGKEVVKLADGSSFLQLGQAMVKLQEVLEEGP